MADRTAAEIGVIVLAGGEAKRLPGKLYLDAGDLPLIVRVYRNVCAGRETMLSCKGALPYEIGMLIDAPAVSIAGTSGKPPCSSVESMREKLAT